MGWIDWIWHVRGSVPLAPGQSSDDAFAKLDPLFRQTGTSHERVGDMLTFTKRDSASQDKMAIFDRGELRIEQDAGGRTLRYHMTSRALLACFLAPLMFLAFALFTIQLVKWQAPSPEAAKAAEAAEAAKKAKTPDVPMNPIDKFLGAPPPEKKDKKKDKEKTGRRGKKPSPTPAYVFAGLFAALYVIGRVLEAKLIKRLFQKKLAGL